MHLKLSEAPDVHAMLVSGDARQWHRVLKISATLSLVLYLPGSVWAAVSLCTIFCPSTKAEGLQEQAYMHGVSSLP